MKKSEINSKYMQLIDQEDYSQAAELLKSSYDLEKNQSKLKNYLHLLLMAEDFSSVLSAMSDNHCFERCYALYRLGRYSECFSSLSKAISFDVSSNTFSENTTSIPLQTLFAQLCYRMGKFEASIAVYESLCGRNEENPEYFANLLAAKAAAGVRDNQSLSHTDNNATVQTFEVSFNRASVLISQGKFEKAYKLMKTLVIDLLHEESDDEDDKRRFDLQLAYLANKLGRYDEYAEIMNKQPSGPSSKHARTINWNRLCTFDSSDVSRKTLLSNLFPAGSKEANFGFPLVKQTVLLELAHQFSCSQPEKSIKILKGLCAKSRFEDIQTISHALLFSLYRRHRALPTTDKIFKSNKFFRILSEYEHYKMKSRFIDDHFEAPAALEASCLILTRCGNDSTIAKIASFLQSADESETDATQLSVFIDSFDCQKDDDQLLSTYSHIFAILKKH